MITNHHSKRLPQKPLPVDCPNAVEPKRPASRLIKLRRMVRSLATGIKSKIGNAAPEKPLDLSHARCGERLKIVSVKSNAPAFQRLRELGFCERMEVCKISDNGALICHLLGCRVAIGRDLGEQIMVEPVSK